MRFLPQVLLVLSLPAGAIGYWLGARVMSALPLPEGAQGLLLLFVPLFIAGLFMLPFLVPFFDRKAKADLAAHRREVEQGSAGKPGPDTPGDQG